MRTVNFHLPTAKLLLSLLCLSLISAAPSSQPASVGRYQLVSARVSVLLTIRGDSQERVLEGLYKIDTATGEVWHYSLSFDASGKVVEKWVPTDGGR